MGESCLGKWPRVQGMAGSEAQDPAGARAPHPEGTGASWRSFKQEQWDH